MPSDVWSDRLLAIVEGRASGDDIERWVDASWNDGRFLDAVPDDLLSSLPATGRPIARYGDSGVLQSEVCFGRSEQPGAVVVHTPAMEPWSRKKARYCVDPHVHSSAHVTVVLQGQAQFFVACGVDADSPVVRVPVRAGSVLVCPASVAHTFGSESGPFTVLSVQSRFVEPSRADFARSVDASDRRAIARWAEAR
jgi:hypothetical protein